jgi:HK97 family phage major capsid protein
MAQTLRHLLERRTRLVAEMREIADQADENGDGNGLTPEQQQAFDRLKAALADLEQAISNRSIVEDVERRIAGQPLAGGADRNLDRELRQFSIVRAIAAAAGLPGVDAGRERELSAEIARRSGRSFQGIAVPLAALSRPVERRDDPIITTGLPSGGPGGRLIATVLAADQYVDLLRSALVIRQFGARVLTGLTGNVDIPRQTGTSNVAWVAENTAVPYTDIPFDRVGLRPKHCGAMIELSRNMLQQSTPDIEQLVRADLAATLARALDGAAIAGTGTANDPVGVLHTSGVTTVPIATNGGPITWATVLSLIEAVELANAPTESRAFLGNPKAKAQAMDTAKVTGVALGMMMEDGAELAGYPFASTTLTPSNGTKGTGTGLSTLIFGAWSEVLIGLWSEIDLLVNPFAEGPYSKGNVLVRGMMTVDIALRHAQSFAIATDIAAP